MFTFPGRGYGRTGILCLLQLFEGVGEERVEMGRVEPAFHSSSEFPSMLKRFAFFPFCFLFAF